MEERQALAQPTGDEAISVFLLDDHELVRRGVREILEAGGDIRVVGEAGTADEAVRLVGELQPQVAVLDWRVPDGSGVEVCRQVRGQWPAVAVLILTCFDDEAPLLDAIGAGAAGYLLKQVRASALVDAVHRIADGESLIDPELTSTLLDLVRAGEGITPPPTARLTAKEREVLTMVGEGLSNRQIAALLGLSEKTVKNHVSALLGKLGLESRTQAAILAIKGSYEPGHGSDMEIAG